MKTVSVEETTQNIFIEAQTERIVVTRQGKPVALVIGIEGMNEEQLQLGSSDKFWNLITQRRGQKRMRRAALENKLGL